MEFIKVNENGIHMLFAKYDDQIRLVNFSPEDIDETKLTINDVSDGWLVEYQETGAGSADHRGRKHIGCNPGTWLKYKDFVESTNEHGKKIEVVQTYQGVDVVSNYQFYNGTNVVRSWTTVINNSHEVREIEFVSSFAYFYASRGGMQCWDQKMELYQAHNSWYDECRWVKNTLPQLGLNPIFNMQSTKRIYEQNEGSWSTQEYLPMGALCNKETGDTYLWQIEHNGSWYWEVAESIGTLFTQNSHNLSIQGAGETSGEIYFILSGPTEWESGWHKSLNPNEKFDSVPVAVSAIQGDFEHAIDQMTVYRRKIRRRNSDNEKLPVIFNDYMNCLFGDSTTEKLIPLIDAASETGCEYFVIDCGWYTDNNWWAGVGQWLPSKRRYPGGIDKPIHYIREKGMIPGIWLEMEVVGFDCPELEKFPRDWFFKRHGKLVSDQCRYQLDFRNPEVREYADKTIDRLVNEYGVGYIKMDYNINSGIGTEIDSDSLGDGLLEHNRAYLAWIDHIFEKYPDLIIENCGSGGMRMDYAQLSRHSIQSSSDQTDYLKNACIAASAATAVTPEQCAIWSYPLSGRDREETTVNMVNAMLFRIHQSGHLGKLPEEQLSIVKEGISVYKQIRSDIKNSVPFWPIGIPNFRDPWFAFGIRSNNCAYIAVWRINGDPVLNAKLPEEVRKFHNISMIYPSFSSDRAVINPNGSVSFNLSNMKSARVFKLF
jgi:alpha-galactosidase